MKTFICCLINNTKSFLCFCRIGLSIKITTSNTYKVQKKVFVPFISTTVFCSTNLTIYLQPLESEVC